MNVLNKDFDLVKKYIYLVSLMGKVRLFALSINKCISRFCPEASLLKSAQFQPHTPSAER
jgi:hypothetical protein